MKYFIHSWKDIGSKFLCEEKDGEILVHGEYDVAGKEWHPMGDAGEAYRPRTLDECFWDEQHNRFRIEECNTKITDKEFQSHLKKIKAYQD